MPTAFERTAVLVYTVCLYLGVPPALGHDSAVNVNSAPCHERSRSACEKHAHVPNLTNLADAAVERIDFAWGRV
jgi:hypothetical protein